MAYDWGVERFLSGMTHTGKLENIDNPRWWQQEKDQTIRLQRAVSRKAMLPVKLHPLQRIGWSSSLWRMSSGRLISEATWDLRLDVKSMEGENGHDASLG